MANWIASTFFVLVGLGILAGTIYVRPWAAQTGNPRDWKVVQRGLFISLAVIAFGVWLAAST